ncbi:hypothetical protein Goarm_010748, partial [Gossypium armourianum]|nr:hypothetical protein [Gossypium armourianum]
MASSLIRFDDKHISATQVIMDLCETFLGKVPNKFQGGHIDMKWLENNFKELLKDATNVVKEQYARAFSVRWNHGSSYMRLSEQLKDIQLLLDQSSEVKFEWMPDADPDIIECVPLEFLAIKVHILGHLRPQHINPDTDVDVDVNVDTNFNACTDIDGKTNVVINASVGAHINID